MLQTSRSVRQGEVQDMTDVYDRYPGIANIVP